MNWQVVVSLIPAVPAVGVFVHTLMKERQPLALIERLSAVAGQFPSGSVRQLVEDYRDDISVRWVMSQRAPKDTELGAIVVLLRIVGSLALTFWALLTVAQLSPWNWALYVGALALWGGAEAVRRARAARRNRWVEQELSWRGITLPDPPSFPKRSRNYR